MRNRFLMIVLAIGVLALFGGRMLFLKNAEEGILNLKKRAEAGEAEALYELGSLYRTGKGVEKDQAKAIASFERAAKLGNRDAQTAMASSHLFGVGVPVDDEKALQWLKLAAERGERGAQFYLGQYHAYRATNLDLVEGCKWFLLSERGGFDSHEELQRIRTKLSASEITQATKLADDFKASKNGQRN